MTKLQLLVEAAEKATPGPMHETGEDFYPQFHWVSPIDGRPWDASVLQIRITGDKRVADAKFVVTAYDAIPELRQMIERLEAAEEVMLKYRLGDSGEAQRAYMDYCGKYIGEPSGG